MKQVLAICILLAGCGLPREYATNPDFDSFKAKFQQETGVEVTTPIIYDVLDEETVALCEIFDDGYRLIRVNTKFWDEMQYAGKEETIYHELGHCELNREHSERLTQPRSFGYPIPASIMYPYIFGDELFYWIFREQYVQELLFPNNSWSGV